MGRPEARWVALLMVGLGWGTHKVAVVHGPWQVGGFALAAPQLGLSAGLPSGLSLTRHSLDLKLARDLQLGMEAREPQRPSMEGVGSFPGERGWVRPGQPGCVYVGRRSSVVGRKGAILRSSPEDTASSGASAIFN